MIKKCPLLLLAVVLALTLAACDKPETKRDKYIARGNALFEAGDYDRAALEYKNAGRLDPVNAQVIYRLGLVAEAKGDIAGAIKAFLAAEQQAPDDAPTLQKLVNYYLAADQIDEARKRADRLMAAHPQDAQALALSAAVDLRTGDFAKAESKAREALQKDKESIPASTVLIGTFANQGRMAEAFGTLDTALAAHPNDLSLLLLRVMMFAKKGDLDGLETAYRALFAAHPKALSFRFDLAQTLEKNGRADKAEAVLREVVSENADDPEAMRRLVSFITAHKTPDVAESEIKALIASHPGQPDLLFWLGELYVNAKAPEKAVALMQEIAHREAEDTKALHAQTFLARLYLSQGQRDTAQKLIALVLKNDPSNADALFVRAKLAYDAGALDACVADLRTLTQNKQTLPFALPLLAETLLQQGRVDMASDSLQQLLTLDPTNDAARVRLAQFYALRKDMDRALETIQLAVKVAPDYPVAWETMARIALQADNKQLADKAIAKLETMDGQKMTATFLRAGQAIAEKRLDDARKALRTVIADNPSAPLASYALDTLAGLVQNDAEGVALAGFVRPFAFVNTQMATLFGKILLAGNQPDEAAAAFDKALTMEPFSIEAAIARANLFWNSGDKAQAEALLRKAIEKEPINPLPALKLADLLVAQDKTAQAAEVYERLLKQNPALDVAANNLAQLYADTAPHNAEAMQRARVLAERFITSPQPFFLDTLGWVYLQAGDLVQAAPVLQRAMDMTPNPPAQMFYHYGLMMLKSGHPEQAREALIRATQGTEAYAGRQEAQKWLDSLPAPVAPKDKE